MVIRLLIFILLLSPLPVFATDSDQDGLSDEEELNIYKTDHQAIDSDGDGYNDYIEVYNGYSPINTSPKKLSTLDSDGDGAFDNWETRLGLDMKNQDTDGDGYDDYTEIKNGYDPRSSKNEKIEKVIKVDIKKQYLSYFFDGIELESFPISGGVYSMPTPLGNFEILNKVESKNYGGTGFDFYYPDTKWNLHFTTNYWRYYIHGAYWHNNFGKPMSHGCVNVAYPQMERLYSFSEIGTRVEIF